MRARMGQALALADLTEQQFARQVCDLAKTYGWRRYHTYRSERSVSGWPDEAFVRDRLILAELKREKTQPSDAQREWLTALAKAGVEIYLFRPSDLQEVAAVFALRSGSVGEPLAVTHSRWLPDGCRADQLQQQEIA